MVIQTFVLWIRFLAAIIGLTEDEKTHFINARQDMTPEFAISEAEELRQQFRSWRRRFLFWKAIDSIGVFVCCVLLSALAISVVDYAIALPWSIRIVLLTAMIAAAMLFLLSVVRLLYNPPSYAALARSIQTQRTAERSSLIAAGMLLDESPEFSNQHRAMIQALHHARLQVRDWNWQASIDRTKPLLWMIVVVLSAAAAFFVWGRGPNILADRWLSLFSSRASQEAGLVFIDPPASVIAGQSIRLKLQHNGARKPDTIKLDVHGSVGDVSSLPSDSANVSSFQITNVQSSLRIQAQTGAFVRSGYLDITLQDRPRVINHEFVITPPSYLDQSVYRSDKTALSIPERSKVTLAVTLNEPIRELQLNAMSESGGEFSFAGKSNKRTVEFDLSSLTNLDTSNSNFNRSMGRLHHIISMSAKQQDHELIDLDYDLELQVHADSPASFAILNPPMNGTELTLAEIGERVAATVTDDYGIDSVKMVIRGVATAVASAEQTAQESRSIYLRDAQSSRGNSALRSVNVDEVLARDSFIAKWPACNAIDCSLVAIDSAGQQSTSPTMRLLLFKKDSEESRKIDAISSVAQMQRQLQKRTDQAARATSLSPELRQQLASEQQEIRSKWQEANSSPEENSEKQKASVSAIDQLMRASQKNLSEGMLEQSSNVQSGILHRLDSLASELNSEASASQGDKQAKSSIESMIPNWSQQQAQVTEWLKEIENLDATDSQSLNAAKETESKLQKEIQQQLETLDESSPFTWPLAQANKSIARAGAKMQRNMVDASTRADAQSAADMLKSLADNMNETQQSSAPKEEENPHESADQKTSSIIQELEIVQSLQNRLHDRLKSIQAEPNPNKEAAAVATISQAQSELAQRTKKLSEALNEK